MSRVIERRPHTYDRAFETSISCDRCGSETLISNGRVSGGRVEVSGFGYGSIHDLTRWEFDVCDGCVSKFTAWFKKAPEEAKSGL